MIIFGKQRFTNPAHIIIPVFFLNRERHYISEKMLAK